ncbi:MAG TPA: YdeI/OmpD-associated family protein [Trebonia sp.]
MHTQRFGALVADGPNGRAIVVVPFDPDEAWGVKAVHHVNGTVNGTRVRVTISPGSAGWAFTLSPSRVSGLGVGPGDEVTVEFTPEGPQRADLAEDIAAALAANPAAGAFFDTLAQFYRKAYLRWIDATTRRPQVRAARIAEVVDLLAAGVKERPR